MEDNWIYKEIRAFMLSLERNSQNLKKYRTLLIYNAMFKDCKCDNTDEDELKIFHANILFSTYAFPKIKMIEAICSQSFLRSLSTTQIIDIFFFERSTLG